MTPLAFDNAFVRELPGDPQEDTRRRQVHGALYSRVTPTPVRAPRAGGVVAGGRRPARHRPGSDGDARVRRGLRRQRAAAGHGAVRRHYGGHQFGNWAGQLGDGRAITLGEVVSARRRALGAAAQGRRPDAVLAHAPTAARCCARRSASSCAARRCITSACRRRARCRLVATGEQVVRDMFYDGHPRAEPGAVVCRVAPSFLRFGNFELPAARGDVDAAAAAGRLHASAATSPTWRRTVRRSHRRKRARPLVRRGLRAHGRR